MPLNTTTPLSPQAAALVDEPAQLIGGAAAEGTGGEPIASIDPYTELRIGAMAPAGAEQVDAALAAARAAFDEGPWPRMSPAARSRALHRAADSLEARRDALIELCVREIGSPVSLSRLLQVDAMIEHFRWFADAAARGPQGGFEGVLAPHAGPPASEGLLLREPVGVVAALTPYNIPLVAAAWKVGGALAAGCTTVLLPSPRAQLIGLAFARCLADADLPPGVFNFVTGGPDTGAALTTDPRVDMVTFTGSTSVGAAIMAQAAPTLKRLTLELGGKSPNIVLPGADLAQAIGASVLRFTRNAGQGCTAPTRAFVPRARYDEYVERVGTVLESLAVGDPADEATVVGPLIRGEHRAAVEAYVERALAAGAVIEAGGGRPDIPHGFFMNPALVGRVTNRDEISREELFGPVAVVIPYDTVTEAISAANDAKYGLAAHVWGPHDEALAVARRLRCGTVTINGGGALRPDAPFGGYRQSGIGREGGDDGFAEFFETKHVQWPA